MRSNIRVLRALSVLATITLMSQISVNQSMGQSPSPRAYVPIAMRDYPAPPAVYGIGMTTSANGNLARLSDTNSSWTRLIGVLWPDIEPTEGARNWGAAAALEDDLRAFASARVNVSLIIQQTPAWAQRVANQWCGPVKPEKYAAMGRFIGDVVKRYSAPPYNVEFYEFWNEPDGPFRKDGVEFRGVGCWGDTSDPYFNGREYGSALKVAYQSAKQVNPNVKIMVGGLLMDCGPNPVPSKPECQVINKFFEGLLITAGGNFDGVSFHAYDVADFPVKVGAYIGFPGWGSAWNTTGPSVLDKTKFIKGRLAAAGVTGKFLINTEVALVVFGGGPITLFTQPERELTKAYYVTQSYAAALSEGLIGNIWYDIGGWFGSGLIRSDGSQTDAYKALKVVSVRLARPRYLGPVTSADLGGATNVFGFKFDRGDRKVWVVWSKDGASHTTNFATAPLEVVDALGVAQSTGKNIPITIKPLYIEWP